MAGADARPVKIGLHTLPAGKKNQVPSALACPGRTGRGRPPDALLHNQAGTQLRHSLRANPLDLVELLDLRERPVLVAVGNDPSSQGRTDPRQGFKLLSGAALRSSGAEEALLGAGPAGAGTGSWQWPPEAVRQRNSRIGNRWRMIISPPLATDRPAAAGTS